MRSASASIRAGLAAVLAGTLLLAIVIAAVWGATFWAFVLAGGGELAVLLWLARTWAAARDRRAVAPGAPLAPRAAPTRRRRLITQLRDVRDAVGALPDAVVLLDRQGHVCWRNAAAIHLLGLQHQHDERPLAERLAGSELGTWLGTDTRQAATDLPAPADPALRLSATMMAFGAHRQLLLARDISPLSRLEQVRRDFIANVSHELRTPLTVIHGYLELLDPADVPELAPVLKEMRMQSQRMRQLVEDLLTLSRLETREALPDEHVAMAPLLVALQHEAQATQSGPAHHHGRSRHRRRLARLAARPAQCVLQPGQQCRALHAKRRQHCHRLARTATGDAAFSVRDSGLGIPAEHLGRLTERFYRVSSSRSRESGGTGLGLSIVKHVLNLHQGRLVIASKPGQGSTFSCVLDASRVLPPESDDSTQAETPAD